MKILHEKGLYVHLKVILFIEEEKKNLLAGVSFKINQGVFPIDPYHKEDFVLFTEPEEVAYFQQFDFILDYLFLISKSLEELQDILNSLEEERMDIANEINSSLDQDENEQDNHFQYSAILYKIKQLKSIMLLKKGECFFPLPMEELPSVFPYDIEPYRIVQLLNPFQFKVTRLDNSKLQVNSEVRNFFSNNLGHFFRYYPFLQDAFGKINMDFSPVNDGREIIVTIHFTPLVSLDEQRDQSNKKYSKLNSL